jgi:hypothetical protein
MARTRTRSRKPAPAGPPEEAAEPGRPGVLDRIKQAPKLAAAIGGIVAAIAGILGLVTWVFPDAKPKPRAPTDATLAIIDFQRHVSLGEYLDTHPIKGANPSAAQRSRDGVVVTVRAADVSGVKRADLFWTVRDEASDATIDRQLAGHLKINTTGDSGAAPYWVPAPSQTGRYFILFELDTQSGTILNTTRTDPFAVA